MSESLPTSPPVKLPSGPGAGAAQTPPSQPLTLTAWLVMIVASIGFLFDTYELLMTPLVLAPALSELLRVPPNHPDVTAWVGRVLWMTALCGGVFGLLGGWLIDRLGRKTVMIGSIFVYSLSPVMAGPEHQPLLADLLPLHHLRRRLCRVRGGRHLAVRTVPRQTAARAGAWAGPRRSPASAACS